MTDVAPLAPDETHIYMYLSIGGCGGVFTAFQIFIYECLCLTFTVITSFGSGWDLFYACAV